MEGALEAQHVAMERTLARSTRPSGRCVPRRPTGARPGRGRPHRRSNPCRGGAPPRRRPIPRWWRPRSRCATRGRGRIAMRCCLGWSEALGPSPTSASRARQVACRRCWPRCRRSSLWRGARCCRCARPSRSTGRHRPAGGRRGGAVRAGVHGGRARAGAAGAGDRRRGAAPPVYTLDDRVDARLARGLDDGRDGALPHGRLGHDLGAGGGRGAGVGAAVAGGALPLAARDRALASAWSGYTLDVRTPPRSLAQVSPRLSRAVRGGATWRAWGSGAGGRGQRGGGRAGGGAGGGARGRRRGGARRGGADALRGAERAHRAGAAAAGARARRGGCWCARCTSSRGRAAGGGVFVTATEPKHLRWLASRPHLLHVATSRAQDHLVVLLDTACAQREPSLRPLLGTRG
jgi:hypothetical protein